MSIDSDQINYLIYRYLIESGFQHSSFTFAQESGITKSTVTANKLPPGALIAHLQKALNYVQAEVNLTEDGRPADLEDLETIEALNLIEACQPEVCQQRRQQLMERLREQNKPGADVKLEPADEAAEPMEVPTDSVTTFRGHEQIVFTCVWHPTEPLLASGSNDATVRIWNLKEPKSMPLILRHLAPPGEEVPMDVTSVQWSPAGELLASGCFDGSARIWTKQGELQCRLRAHTGPLFCLRWSPSGKQLLTCSVDQSAIVWDVASGTTRRVFTFHHGPCVGVAWKSEEVFASCSIDGSVIVCHVTENEPLHRFTGHTDEVNVVSWHAAGQLLASCSDDNTARIWSLEAAACQHVLRHDDKLYTLAWARPFGVKRTDATLAETDMRIATASFDRTIKVWDGRKGSCIFSLVGHTSPVYSVCFSHDCRYVASGSFDHRVIIWSLENGQPVATRKQQEGIYEVGWDAKDEHVSLCTSGGIVAVIQAPR